jgi:hypothetical protein
MPFPFTFSFSVPGLHNPFTAAAQRPQPAAQRSRTDRKDAPPDPAASVISRRNHAFPPSRRSSPSPSLVPLARKRGWAPSIPEPSQAATSAHSIGGYLDTPAKYRHMVHEAPERETEDMFAGAYHHVFLCFTSDTRAPTPCGSVPRVAHAHGLQFFNREAGLLLLYLSPFDPLSFMFFGIVIDIDVDFPPAKRRRTLAGSIVSTALSAALIGTAVGLTVYRL